MYMKIKKYILDLIINMKLNCFLLNLKFIRVEKITRINNMNLFFFERNILNYEKNKKKLAQFLIFYYLMHACVYMSKV